MELPVAVQLREGCWFILLGAGLGLLYDMLGGLRDRAGRPAGAAADGLFALAAVGALFAGGMASLEGRARLYMLACAGLGGGLWAWAVSPVIRPLFRGLWRGVSKCCKIAAWPLCAGGVF